MSCRSWSRALFWLAFCLWAGCAKSAAPSAQVTPEAQAARKTADSVRGAKLSVALKSGAPSPRVIPSTYKLTFDVSAAREGVAGSAIVAFVVLPNGRVDRDTRTLILVEGHQIYAKHICDALLAARFEPAPPDARGAVGVMPVFFSVRGGASRDSASRQFAETQRRMRQRFAEMSEAEAQGWFAARPNCSAIKIGLDPLYGPPPQ